MNKIYLLIFYFISQSLYSQVNFKETFEGTVSPDIQLLGCQVWTNEPCAGQKDVVAVMATRHYASVVYNGGRKFNSNPITIKYKVKTKRDNSSYLYIISGFFNVEYSLNNGDWIVLTNAQARGNACNEKTVTIPEGVVKRGDDLKIRFYYEAYPDPSYSAELIGYSEHIDDIEITQDYKDYIIYTAPNATGDGSSWDNPMDLADALKWAQIHALDHLWSATDPLKIWVKKGVYYPKYDASRISFGTVPSKNAWKAFYLPLNVKLYGNFNGTENSLSDRVLPNDYNYESVLSGDFNNDDAVVDNGNTVSITNVADNAFHVLISEAPYFEVPNVAEVNGFTIKGGNAIAGTSTQSIYHTIFDSAGGAIYVSNTQPTLRSLALINNTSSIGGAAIFNYRGYINGDNVLIKNNISQNGAGVYNDGAGFNLSRLFLTKNYSMTGYPGIMTINTGVGNVNTTSMLTNSLISKNYSKNSGPLSLTDPRYPMYFTNVTMVGNDFTSKIQGSTFVRNSIIFEPFPYANVMPTFSLISGRSGRDNNNIDGKDYSINDVFIDASLTDSNYRLKKNSPTRGMGTYGYYTTSQQPNISTLITDMDGSKIDDKSVDMGAFQYRGELISVENDFKKTKVFPVPFKDQLTIDNSDSIQVIEIYDALGRLVLKESPNKKSVELSTQNLEKGLYIIKIIFTDRVETVNVIK